MNALSNLTGKELTDDEYDQVVMLTTLYLL